MPNETLRIKDFNKHADDYRNEYVSSEYMGISSHILIYPVPNTNTKF